MKSQTVDVGKKSLPIVLYYIIDIRNIPLLQTFFGTVSTAISIYSPECLSYIYIYIYFI